MTKMVLNQSQFRPALRYANMQNRERRIRSHMIHEEIQELTNKLVPFRAKENEQLLKHHQEYIKSWMS